MVMAIGEDMMAGLVVKSTCVLIYHLLGSVISLVVGWPLRVGSVGGDHFGKVGHTVGHYSVIIVRVVSWWGWSGWWWWTLRVRLVVVDTSVMTSHSQTDTLESMAHMAAHMYIWRHMAAHFTQ